MNEIKIRHIIKVNQDNERDYNKIYKENYEDNYEVDEVIWAKHQKNLN